MTTKNFEDALQELLPRKKDQLPLELLTNQPYCKLDFTPIFINDGSEIENMCEDLPTEIDPEELMDYIKTNRITISNLRTEFLSRYTFSALNRTSNSGQQGLDKNVNYLGINNQVDFITFVRKLRVATS